MTSARFFDKVFLVNFIILEKENSKISSIVIRGSTLNFLDDVERAIDDGINVVKTLTKDGRLLPGAGSSEIELALQLDQVASKTPGLSQYGIKKFSEAFEAIPYSLCVNSGQDPSLVIPKLYSFHKEGKKFLGVNIDSTDSKDLMIDALDSSIMDMFASKRSALFLATDAVLSILRVDSIIMSKPAGGPKPRQPVGGMDDTD